MQQEVALRSVTETIGAGMKAKARAISKAPEPQVGGIRVGGRSARVVDEVLKATIELIGRSGYGSLRVEEVALRSTTKLVWPWYPGVQVTRISVGPWAAAATASGGAGVQVMAVAGSEYAEVP